MHFLTSALTGMLDKPVDEFVRGASGLRFLLHYQVIHIHGLAPGELLGDAEADANANLLTLFAACARV